jgi:lysozyme family protein
MTDQPTHPPPLEYEAAEELAPTDAPPNFDMAFEEIIGLEGGYVHDDYDYGGETNWGISKRAYPEVDIKNLTMRGAKAIYLRDYWNRMLLDKVDDPDIAMELFEQGVNLGTSRAITHLQNSINIISEAPGVMVDGVIGPETLDAVNKIAKTDKKEALLKCLNGYQFSHYLGLVENDLSQKRFLVGWLKRIA